MKMKSLLLIVSTSLVLLSCQKSTEPDPTILTVVCDSASVLKPGVTSPSKHKFATHLKGASLSAIPDVTLASADSVKAFFGGKRVKFVVATNRKMYLVDYAGGAPVISRISHDDEALDSTIGSINSPLFSKDGKKIVFAGTALGKPAFVQDAVAGDSTALRVPLDPQAHVTADPHWHSEGGKDYVYFATLAALIGYSDHCHQIPGATYRREITGDTSFGPIELTGIPGAYRGGVSQDGNWVGTSYATSALYDKSSDVTHELAGGHQQCNPSMNPFPVGSKHMDYMMILAFGGNYLTITGDSVSEASHENFWIYNKDNKIVWRASRPDSIFYLQWDKPEWSTHPNYATAIAIRNSDKTTGDAYVVKVGDLADADEGKLNKAQGYLKLGEGGFNSESYTHLWVEP